MNSTFFFFVVLSCSLFFVGHVFCQTPGKIVYLTEAAQKQGAMCLDGSPGAYYFSPGSGTGTDKWFIFHMGGGWCTSPADCEARSTSSLGSSSKNFWPTTLDMTVYGGYFQRDPVSSPQLYNWNYVLYVYCDGGSYGGNNSVVAKYNGKSLYYRGKRIIQAAVDNLLQNQGMNNATDVVISGCSAGALAVWMHLDWYRSVIPKHIKVAGLPDSGFFVDFNSYADGYESQMQWVYKNQNISSDSQCLVFYTSAGAEWKCIFAQYIAPFVKTAVFPLQSKFDSWQIVNDLNSTNPVKVNEYGANMTNLFIADVLVQKENGGFMDSCAHHCGYWGEITIQSHTQPTAFQAWYEGKIESDDFFFQNETYPCANCCGSSQKQQNEQFFLANM